MSTTTSRPANSITNTVRDNRYSGFTSCSNNRISEPASLGSSFGKTNNTWQSSNEAWTINNISHGTSNAKRDTLKSSVECSGDSSDIHSGSSAFAESSEAESWLGHSWNHLRKNSQKIQIQNENFLPPKSQKAFSFPNVQNIIETQNKYQKSTQSTFGHRISYSRSNTKNPGSLDSLLAPYKFVQEDTAKIDKNEIASQPYLNFDKFGMELSRYLPSEGTQSKEGSVMTSGASDTELNSNNTLYGNSKIQSTLASKNITSSSIPSQSSSYSSLESSHTRQTDINRFDISSNSSNLGEGIESDTEDISSSPSLRSRRSHNKSSLGLHYFPSPTKTTAWNENPQVTNNKKERFSYRMAHNQPYNEKAYGYIERGLASSSITENHRCPNMATNSYTAPPVIDRYDYNNIRIPLGPSNLERRSQNGHSTYPPAYVLDTQVQNHTTPYFYELPRATLRSDQLSPAIGYPFLIPPYQSSQMILAHSAKDQDVGTGFRSVLLEDFRKNTKYNKKYEIKDLYFHIVEFSGDQHGSRFIQTKLETANSDDKEQIFREIQPNALQLMTDVYGNYVIQKLFEHGNQVQKRMLAQQLKNHVMELSLQMYGCRVVQKALEHVLDDQQSKLVEELRCDILKCIKDQNGNHVVQKAIERVPSKYIQFIIEAFRGKVEVLAVHPYGCRVIQRILEFCKPHDLANILKELHDCSEMLISDQYGNYVIQHVIQHGTSEDRDKIQSLVSGKLLKFSKHKFASNVVERCIIFGTDEQRRQMVSHLTSSNIDGIHPLQLMMKDQFGNYVIQKLLAKLNGNEKTIFLSAMKTQLPQIKRFNYGKQIDVIEKLLHNSSQSSQYGSSSIKAGPNSTSTTSDFFNASKIDAISDTSMVEMRNSFVIENKPNSEIAINMS